MARPMKRVVAMMCVLPFVAAHAQGGSRPTGTLVASNMNDNTATVIDASSGRVLATLPTGEGPHEVAISHDGKWAVVSNYGVRGKPGNSLTVIDVAHHAVARTIVIQDQQRPHGMMFLPGDSLLAVTDQTGNSVLLLDFHSGTVARVIPTGGRGSHMIGLSADGSRIVSGNIADGTISVIATSGAGAPVVTHVAAQPEGVAIAPDGSTAWAGSNKDSVVLVVDLAKAQPVDTLRGFGLPYRMAVTPDGRRAVITDPMMAQVRIFDAQTRRQRALIQVPRDSVVATAEVPGSPSPEGVAISRDSRWAFVTLQGRNRLATIDIERGVIVALAPTGTWSDGVGYSPVISTP
jgi:YVTN family beta-propeller protein